MSFLDRINLFLVLLFDPIRQSFRISLWWPLLLYGLLQALVLYAHYQYVSPLFHGPVSAWISLFGPGKLEAFGHYPQQLLLLGTFAGWAKLLVGLPLEGGVLALLAVGFYRRYLHEEPETAVSLATRWVQITLVWVVINGLMLLAGMLIPGLLAPLLNSTKRQLAFSFVFMPAVFSGIVALTYMAYASVAVLGMNCLSALLYSLKLFFRRPILTLCLAGTILAVPAVLSAVASRPDEIVRRFNPDLVFWILLASLVTELVALYFWIGSSVRWLLEPER